ncbi:MAG: hypothetical protein JWL61_2905 [Gemmatimonadetes bacterium]|nr:hypothetical protein [Gemmatimonadota bacterium]
MFGSEILDVAIGVALVFLMMSFLATAIREAIESVVKARAVYLERGIRQLLDDIDGTGIAQAFYEHPLIFSLYAGEYDPKDRRFLGRALPSYVPARNFADTLIDLAIRGPVKSEYAIMQTDAVPSVAALRANVGRLRSPQLIRAVLTAMDHAGNDMNVVRQNIQTWFDSGMDRVSGQYKRHTHFWLFLIGLVLAAGLNVNAIVITNHLARNKAVREALVARASEVTRDSLYVKHLTDTAFGRKEAERVREQLNELNLPIGIDKYHWPDSWKGYIPLIGGILITAFAVTLGAPFWFDALNKMMVIRSTVKPHEKSPEESSEDRQKPKDKKLSKETEDVAPPPPPAGDAANPPPPPPPPERASVPSAPTQEWATGQADEGIL